MCVLQTNGLYLMSFYRWVCEFLCNFLRICIIDNRKNCDIEIGAVPFGFLRREAPRLEAGVSSFVCVSSSGLSHQSQLAWDQLQELVQSTSCVPVTARPEWWGWRGGCVLIKVDTHTHARTQHGTLVSLDVRQNAAKVDVIYWEFCSAVCVGAKHARTGRSGAARQPSSRPVTLSALSQEPLVLGCRLVFTF